MYPEMQPFNPGIYTFPNSICIYPDGRTSLADAVLGNMDLYLGQELEHYDYNTGWSHFEYSEQGLELDANSSVVLCDSSVAYLLSDPSFVVIGQQPIRGGGHTAVDSQGNPVASAILHWAPDYDCGVFALQLFINSPDISGDLIGLLAISCGRPAAAAAA